jgi:hypothetical protein
MADNYLFNTDYNYQKVYLDGSTTVSVPDSGGPPPVPTTYTVVHGLGYIPTARVFYEPVSGQIWPASKWQYPNTGGGSGAPLDTTVSCYLTTTSLVFSIINTSGSTKNVPVYWRIYVDE